MADQDKKEQRADTQRTGLNTVDTTLMLVLEMYILDHQNARFGGSYNECGPTAGGSKQTKSAAGRPDEKFSLPVGRRATGRTTPFEIDKYKDKIIELSELRLQVMKNTGKTTMRLAGPVLDPPLGPKTIGYHDNFYITETQFMSYAVYTNPDELKKVYGKENKSKGGTAAPLNDPSYRQNRLLISWDEKQKKVLKYILDGEEIDVEGE